MQPEPSTGVPPNAGQAIDDGKGRVFPCEQCGADLKFEIGQQKLHCPFCGWSKELEIKPDAVVAEQDYNGMLARLAEKRKEGKSDEVGSSEIRCSSCGATVTFNGALTSTECACCGSPLQREHVHDSADRVPADGVLPFLVDQNQAQVNMRQWVQSRWFAPTEFRQRGVNGKFNGMYLPFWTFDTMTFNRFAGQRGEHYMVTVGEGQNRRTETRTRWYPVDGAFQQFFDDVMVCAATGLPDSVMASLGPWQLDKCVPFNQQMLAGFLAQTYVVPLDQGFSRARAEIDEAIASSVRGRIGGDEQRIDSIKSRYDAISYKHLLLPVWLLAYRYRDKPYQVVVNASTGEVQGERPYSWIKITLFSLAIAAAVAAVVFFVNQG
jgi:predicted RNA-binding Zn-ribbon protein involved in translation (DUF1610 family)